MEQHGSSDAVKSNAENIDNSIAFHSSPTYQAVPSSPVYNAFMATEETAPRAAPIYGSDNQLIDDGGLIPTELFDPVTAENIFKQMEEAEAREREEKEAAEAAAAAAALAAQEAAALAAASAAGRESSGYSDSDEEEDLQKRRNPPKTPPLTPGMVPLPGEPGYVPPEEAMDFSESQQEGYTTPQFTIGQEEGAYDDVSDDGELPSRPRVGPKTPPEEDYVPPPEAMEIERALHREAESRKTEEKHSRRKEEKSSKKSKSKKSKGPRTPPSRSRQSSRTPSPSRNESSPVRRQSGGNSRKRRAADEKTKHEVDAITARELTFPALATQKCLSLLEFVERKGLTITDDELLSVVKESIVLDKAMGVIVDKREEMKKQMDEMVQSELDNIKKIHSNMPRHMQDVLKFDEKTVHISQERAAMPPMPFSSSSFMSLKYGQPLGGEHMGVPPPGLPPPPFSHGMPPPMGAPPPHMGLTAPPFAVPPPVSLLGPPPFSVPPIVPPPVHGSGAGDKAAATGAGDAPQRAKDSESSRNLPQGLNPIAFSNAPPGLKLAPLSSEYARPPPAKKPALQNPQMNRIANNLSNMLTNALKAQVSKSPFNTTNTPTPAAPSKKAVPSLMSINIPGVPKPGGPSGPSK